MPSTILSVMRLCCAVMLCAAAAPYAARAQQSPVRPPQEQPEVIRVNTELVQTDVTVLDKEGRFVEGLKQEQFQLKVDGKAIPISFFERVEAGSINEEAQLAAARGGAARGAAIQGNVVPLDRGRTLFFFIDDMHQSPASLNLTRKFLLEFIEKEMGQNDQVAITSASGQIGFLQQLTDHKSVLRAAVARLTLGRRPIRDMERPAMNEALALAIEVRHDRNVLDFYMEPLIKEGYPADTAESMVRSRAQQILQQSYYFTNNTLLALESLARTSAGLPGRKVIFFLSDGFYMNPNEATTFERLRNITNVAARNQVVIYSLDARGLAVSEAGMASEEVAFDPTGRLSSYVHGDLSATQEPLRVLAGNTGGRAILNSNDLGAGVVKAVRETSRYYLLAWRPEGEEQRGKKFRRIEVKVAGRPDLSVQVRGGFYDAPPPPPAPKQGKADAKQPAQKTADDELKEALRAPHALRSLPTLLDVSYVEVPGKGPVLSSSAQVESRFLGFEPSENKSKAVIDIMGVVLNDQGKAAASFKDRLDLVVGDASPEVLARRPLIYSFPAQVKPGLYQVRVAARDGRTGRAGSAMRWIEVPDLSQGKLTMSSLLLSETTPEAEGAKARPDEIAQSRASVDRRFGRASKLRFVAFIYNASRGAEGRADPDVALQIQVMRDDQPVLTAPLRKVQPESEGDPARMAYAADIALDSMPPGRYVLQITVIDRLAKTSAMQSTTFDVE